MPREVNAEKLYELLDRMMNPNRSGPIKIDLDAALPKVAEPAPPAPYDYHADWTRHPDPSGNNDVTWFCNYCDGWTDCKPKARHNCPEQPPPAEPVIDEPAPAADPRRLTREEIALCYGECDFAASGKTVDLIDLLNAVADAQLAKARVTISEAEILDWWQANREARTLTALLRSKGVEVTDD